MTGFQLKSISFWRQVVLLLSASLFAAPLIAQSGSSAHAIGGLEKVLCGPEFTKAVVDPESLGREDAIRIATRLGLYTAVPHLAAADGVTIAAAAVACGQTALTVGSHIHNSVRTAAFAAAEQPEAAVERPAPARRPSRPAPPAAAQAEAPPQAQERTSPAPSVSADRRASDSDSLSKDEYFAEVFAATFSSLLLMAIVALIAWAIKPKDKSVNLKLALRHHARGGAEREWDLPSFLTTQNILKFIKITLTVVVVGCVLYILALFVYFLLALGAIGIFLLFAAGGVVASLFAAGR